MAKTLVQMDQAVRPGKEIPALDTLSAKVRNAIKAVKRQFRSYAEEFSVLQRKRSELAPKFMKAYGLWNAETTGSFVDFVRLFDDTIGKSAAEYRRHPTYNAADYLRRLHQQMQRGKRVPGTGTAARATMPATPTEGMARLIAAITTLIGEEQKGTLFEAVRAELHWSERQANRLQNQSEHVDPLIIIKAPRGQQVPSLRLSFPEHRAEEVVTEAA